MKSSLNGAVTMRSQGCCRLVVGALAMLSAGLWGASHSLGEEAARPPKEWFDARQHEGADKAKIDEKLRDEKAWGTESTRPRDITNEPKRDFHDLNDLGRKTERADPTKTIEIDKSTKEKLSMLSEKSSRITIDPSKFEKQMRERGWSEQQVQSLGKTEPTGKSIDNSRGRNDPATVYGSPERHIVVSDIDRSLVQISGPEWKPDSRILWDRK